MTYLNSQSLTILATLAEQHMALAFIVGSFVALFAALVAVALDDFLFPEL